MRRSIAAFPEELPLEMLGEIFAAADAQVRIAGGLLAGGHTIRDAEPKYGLAVVGTVGGARLRISVGDRNRIAQHQRDGLPRRWVEQHPGGHGHGHGDGRGNGDGGD